MPSSVPEFGKQRRTTQDGRLLHCCCICLTLAPWGDQWVYFSSVLEMDEGKPYPKFCSAGCKVKGGHNAENVTAEMAQEAKEREWRDPKPHYRRPSYNDALHRQRRLQKPEGN